MIVSFQDRLKGSIGEDEVHIMSYDLSQKKTLWLFNKKDDKNITLSVKIRQQESLIITLALNKKILYIDLLSGYLRAEFDIYYKSSEPFLIVYDIYGKAYIGLNGQENLQSFLNIIDFQFSQLQIQETLVQNLRGYFGNYLQSICISDDDNHVYMSIHTSITVFSQVQTYRIGIVRISTIDSSNHKIYYQSAFTPGENQSPIILLYSLSAGSDYCVGLMAHEQFSSGGIIGLSVLNITTGNFTLHYQTSFEYIYIKLFSSIVTKNSTARFFVKVQPTTDAIFFQYIVTVEDIKSPDKMIF
ncbi:UNKNOWN [Stylonychia lemnae]|uniref:Uncharacterized protein n=1 Tax=Stylonychia lemnae TaxID=5949 RepID=A0A077ZRZ4_STYLE|nr:UNKNOWN [Stylonychia lemnae]|eukprot:CDW71251.1 UNKNOWN [Stylonychia lemnae]